MKQWTEKFTIDNIEFTFKQCNNGLMSDTENLGIGSVIMPGTMSKRFAKEVGDGIIPHYDTEESKDSIGRDHECYNSDTQIVLMNWLFNKRRKYKLDYFGLDPFWIFHDSRHAKNDVVYGEVGWINSYIEHERLLEGANFAASKGIHITADTVIKLERDWNCRWTRLGLGREQDPQTLNGYEFFKFMVPEQIEIAEFWLEDPASYQTDTITDMY